MPEVEVVDDLLDIRREPVEQRLEVSLQLLLAGTRPQVAQGEFRGVVEFLASGLSKSGVTPQGA